MTKTMNLYLNLALSIAIISLDISRDNAGVLVV